MEADAPELDGFEDPEFGDPEFGDPDFEDPEFEEPEFDDPEFDELDESELLDEPAPLSTFVLEPLELLSAVVATSPPAELERESVR